MGWIIGIVVLLLVYWLLRCSTISFHPIEGDDWTREREANRVLLRRAAKIAGFVGGQVDDEFCCDEECGVRFGNWVLCYGELACNRGDGVFVLIGSDSDEQIICEGMRSPNYVGGKLRELLSSGVFVQT